MTWYKVCRTTNTVCWHYSWIGHDSDSLYLFWSKVRAGTSLSLQTVRNPSLPRWKLPDFLKLNHR